MRYTVAPLAVTRRQLPAASDVRVVPERERTLGRVLCARKPARANSAGVRRSGDWY